MSIESAKRTRSLRGKPRPARSRGPGPRHRRTADQAASHGIGPGGLPRLQKVMAAAGIGSRRACEALILAGRVEVDGQPVVELGAKVDPQRQEIRVDGARLPRPRRVTYLVNKPIGVVSTSYDPAGRPRVIDLLPATSERVYTVGRLDLTSEGLILVTNDGALANELTHPRYGVEKTYKVQIAGIPTPEALAELRGGIRLAEGPARVVSLRVKGRHKQSTILEVVLAEGRNREIRRILARVGHKVLRLRRVAIGQIRLKDLAPGAWRRLQSDELRGLRQAIARRGGPANLEESQEADPSQRGGADRHRGRREPTSGRPRRRPKH